MTLTEDARGRLPAYSGLPGVRTFRSRPFRLVVAISVWALAAAVLSALLLRQAGDPAGQYAFDFQVYYAAAADLAAGRSPYAPTMFQGPIAAQGELLYKYPPVVAQVLIPLTVVATPVAAAIWLAVQTLAVYAATWLAARLGGAPRTLETFCWCGVATTLFLPAFDTIWKGNVSGILAFFAAASLAGGVGGGLAIASSVLVKTTPVLMLPAALASRRALSGLLIGLVVLLLSVVVAPGAWADFISVLPNLVAGTAAFPTNLAPDSQVRSIFPTAQLIATLTRVLAVVASVVAIGLAVVVSRRPGGWPAAVVLGVAATLLLPSAAWYHYLAVLLPLAAFAWPRADRPLRLALVAGGFLITVALVYLPLALAGSGVITVAVLVATWPHRSEATA